MRRVSTLGPCAIALVALAVPPAASAHVERAAYFPDPAAERVGGVKTGGKVPKPRSLGSALRRRPPGETRVVCHEDSLQLLRESVRRALEQGFEIRPTDQRKLSEEKAKRLKRINRELFERCEYDQIQPAVDDSHNNDRVVIMPGVYTERTARRQPTNDPACAEHLTNGDPPSRTGALSYRYQAECPNDQNLIAVIGRRPGKVDPPSPPPLNRHGIPDAGRCIRCNLQIEGSGVSADDTVIEAGKRKAGNGGPSGVGSKKDVGIRADRADGFVLRNVTVRHAAEHGIYVLETDGYLLDRFKVYFNGLYGTLTFVDDHGRQSNCDGAGHGDSALYPGAPTETGQQRPEGTEFRLNQEVTRCDMHHNLAGYSATNGNAVHVHHNNLYDNALGFNTDAVTAPGHPGFPGDSSLVEHNNFFSNNFNVFATDSDVIPAFPYPVGTGFWIAGGNHHILRENRIWDNWRRGTMLLSVPDALICGPDSDNEQAGCDPSRVSTSHFNGFHDNKMGFVPARFQKRRWAKQLEITAGGPDGSRIQPNGTDFWWDDFPDAEGNCWFANASSYGEPLTSPSPLPDCVHGTQPSQSMGKGNPVNEGELINCFVVFTTRNFDPESSTCPWLRPPTQPQHDSNRAAADAAQRRANRQAYRDFCSGGADRPICSGSH